MNDAIVPEIAKMMGRPVRYGGEFGGVDERTAYMAGIAEEALAPIVIEESAAFGRRIQREAHGVVFVIAPWNYPYLTAINTISPALIAGNGVVIKHSTQTLLAGERIVEAFVSAGLPKDLFVNLYLDHGTTEQLIQSRAFNFINFTGSVGGGAAIERAAAGTFCGVGLELGGKDPGYVMEDANLDAGLVGAARGAADGAGVVVVAFAVAVDDAANTHPSPLGRVQRVDQRALIADAVDRKVDALLGAFDQGKQR